MNEIQITSVQYISDEGINVSIKATIDGVEVCVPIDGVGNRHYDEIMRQVEAGELTIAEAE